MNMSDAVAFSAMIIGIICISGIWLDAYKRRLLFRERELEAQVKIAEAGTRTTGTQFAQIEARVQVLERIATDKGAGLAREIETLRDAPRTEALFQAHTGAR